MSTHGAEASENFSLVRHGLAYRLVSRLGATAREQAAVLVAITWVPAALLSIAEGTATANSSVRVPFFYDLATHARLLLALQLYILLEGWIDQGPRQIVAELIRRDLVADRDGYLALVRRMERVLESRIVDVIILVLAITRAQWSISLRQITSWISRDPGVSLTAAGWWFSAVALPIVFFFAMRWIFRFLVWSLFLVRVARLRLNVISTHPDGAGGIGFISMSHPRFALLAFTANAVFSANIANSILFSGHRLPDYKMAILGIVFVQILVMVAPLLAFVPKLVRLYFEGRTLYGRLAIEYVREFEGRWIKQRDANEVLLGSADIQSLADLANSYHLVADIRPVLFRREEILRIVFYTAIPYAPLILTMMSVEELLQLVGSVVK